MGYKTLKRLQIRLHRVIAIFSSLHSTGESHPPYRCDQTHKSCTNKNNIFERFFFRSIMLVFFVRFKCSTHYKLTVGRSDCLLSRNKRFFVYHKNVNWHGRSSCYNDSSKMPLKCENIICKKKFFVFRSLFRLFMINHFNDFV